MKVIVTPEARTDIAAAAAWYRARSIRAIEEFLLAVSVAFARIGAQPTAHVVVDDETGARRALLRKFPSACFTSSRAITRSFSP